MVGWLVGLETHELCLQLDQLCTHLENAMTNQENPWKLFNINKTYRLVTKADDINFFYLENFVCF